jgi:hypothetical protein
VNEFTGSHAARRLKWQLVVCTFGVTALAVWILHAVWPVAIQSTFYSTAAEIEVVLMGALILEQRIFQPGMPTAEEGWASMGISTLATSLMFAMAGAAGLFGPVPFGPTVAGMVAALTGLVVVVLVRGVTPPPDVPVPSIVTRQGTRWYASLRACFEHRPDRVTTRLRPRLYLWESVPGCGTVTYRACWIPSTREVIAVQSLDGEWPRLWGPVEVLGTLDAKQARRLLGRHAPLIPRWESLDSLRARLTCLVGADSSRR